MKGRIHLEIEITGYVQELKSVYFELYKQARLLDIRGFIRFRSPDVLFFELEGDQKQVDAYTDWCRTFFHSENTRFTMREQGRFMHYSDFFIRE